MNHDSLENVVLVCGCPETAPRILGALYEGGFDVSGPVATTGLALTLASQTAFTIALVATAPEGRRGAAEFGRVMMDVWGVRTWVLPSACEPALPSASWAAEGARLARLKAVLTGLYGEEPRH